MNELMNTVKLIKTFAIQFNGGNKTLPFGHHQNPLLSNVLS